MSDSLIDTLFDGRYRIVRKLGAGGMADVYLAEDQELGRRVAIKILNGRHANDDQFIERFRREAKNAAALNHPNIVSIYDRGEAEDTYYIAMEYLDGRTLKELIVGRGAAPINVAVEYARQILSALRFAHRHGIVHRDIKPHNVLVDREGRVKVTDFGIARAGTSQMTEAGSIVGTAQYLSPEQARGRRGRPALRSLLARRRPLRAPHRQDAVRRRHAGRDRDEAPLGDAAAALADPPRRPARPRHGRDARAREEPGRRGTRAPTRWRPTSSACCAARAVAAATTDSATQVIRRPAAAAAAASATAATMIAPPPASAAPPPTVVEEEDEYEEDGDRPLWPWLVAVALRHRSGDRRASSSGTSCPVDDRRCRSTST